MISVALFGCVCKAGTFIISGLESIPCPYCEGKLFFRGTCKRKLKTTEKDIELRLRVMECCKCGKTHRELPKGIAPYSRYSVEMINVILSQWSEDEHIQEESSDTDIDIESYIPKDKEEKSRDRSICESSTYKRFQKWVCWFIAYAESILYANPYKNISYSPAQKLRFYIREVVNSGQWKKQHRSDFSSG